MKILKRIGEKLTVNIFYAKQREVMMFVKFHLVGEMAAEVQNIEIHYTHLVLEYLEANLTLKPL